MLRRGDERVLHELPNLDLEATPALLETAQGVVRRQAERQRPADPAMPPSPDTLTSWLSMYGPSLRWLTAKGVDLRPEVAALMEAGQRYKSSPARERFLDELPTIVAR